MNASSDRHSRVSLAMKRYRLAMIHRAAMLGTIEPCKAVSELMALAAEYPDTFADDLERLATELEQRIESHW